MRSLFWRQATCARRCWGKSSNNPTSSAACVSCTHTCITPTKSQTFHCWTPILPLFAPHIPLFGPQLPHFAPHSPPFSPHFPLFAPHFPLTSCLLSPGRLTARLSRPLQLTDSEYCWVVAKQTIALDMLTRQSHRKAESFEAALKLTQASTQ